MEDTEPLKKKKNKLPEVSSSITPTHDSFPCLLCSIPFCLLPPFCGKLLLIFQSPIQVSLPPDSQPRTLGLDCTPLESI